MRTLSRIVQGAVITGVMSSAWAAFAQAPPPVSGDRPSQPASSGAQPGTNGTNNPQAAGQTPAQPANGGVGPTSQPERVEINPQGLTAQAVGERARTTSFSTKASSESLRSAAARVDQAWVAFLPRINTKASYTRLSDFQPPALVAGGSGGFAGTTANVTPGAGGLPPNSTFTIPFSSFSFPIILDNWLLTAGIVVPISDYFLRINEAYTAALNSEDAARYDVAAANARAQSDGMVAYYTWLRAKGAVGVANQALEDQKTHLNDAKNQFTVGNASKADVLRAETGVAAAELALERAKNLESLTATQVKVAIHARDEEQISTAEDIAMRAPPVALTLAQAVAEAQAGRPELKGLSANADALRQQIKAARAGYYPSVSAFADGIYANPNPRRFPAANEWFPTWDVGAQLTWSPNDVLLARAGAADADARVANIEAQKQAFSDGITIETTQAWQAVKEADYAIETTGRQVTSAAEAYRVARELFNAGRATSTTLTDAETDLVRARLEVINAQVDARIARIRLDHALGRDAKVPAAPQH